MPVILSAARSFAVAVRAIVIALVCCSVSAVAFAQGNCRGYAKQVAAHDVVASEPIARASLSDTHMTCDRSSSIATVDQDGSTPLESACDCFCAPTSALPESMRLGVIAPASRATPTPSAPDPESVSFEVNIPPIIRS